MEQVFSLIQQYDFSILNYIWLYGHAHWLDIFMEEATDLGNGGAIWIALGIFFMFQKKIPKSRLHDDDGHVHRLCSLELGR